MTGVRCALATTLMISMVGLVGLTTTAKAQPPANQGGKQQSGAVALGGLFNTLVNLQNVPVQVNVQNTLNNLLQSSNISVLNLNNVLNGSQIGVLSGILNNSNVLSGIVVTVRNVLSNSLNGNTVLQGFLSRNNINVSDVVAINVLSGRVTLITFNPR